jgi:hypothetical protein
MDKLPANPAEETTDRKYDTAKPIRFLVVT